jgi:diguanylate cyclase (GGDEF)-like protein
MADVHEIPLLSDAIRIQVQVMNAFVAGEPLVDTLQLLLTAIQVRFPHAVLGLWMVTRSRHSSERVWTLKTHLGVPDEVARLDGIAVDPGFAEHAKPFELMDATGWQDGAGWRWFGVKNTKSRIVGWLAVETPNRLSASETFIVEQYTRMAGLIIEKSQLDEENYFLAYHDYLTEVPNRRLFQQRLEFHLEQARRSLRPVSLVLLDVNRFKTINDTYGHRVGDEVLRVVASRLAAGIENSDTVARMGGDEFGLIFPHVDGPTALRRVKRLMARIAEPLTGFHALSVEASAGIAMCPTHAKTADALLHCADTALYEAKKIPTYGVSLYGV